MKISSLLSPEELPNKASPRNDRGIFLESTQVEDKTTMLSDKKKLFEIAKQVLLFVLTVTSVTLIVLVANLYSNQKEIQTQLKAKAGETEVKKGEVRNVSGEEGVNHSESFTELRKSRK